MQVHEFTETVSRLTYRMMALLVHAFGQRGGGQAPGGLPAGALYFPSARLILSTTCCTAPLFEAQMRAAAAATGADVVLMRHGLFPETLNATVFDALIHVNGQPVLLTDLILYEHPADGFWLVPSGNGAHIALEPDGLRLADEPPFVTWQERCDAVCRAANLIARCGRSIRSW